MGMRSDSPRVAAANEARRTSAGGGKRVSLDTDLKLKAEAVYDSPTLLPPRRVFIPPEATTTATSRPAATASADDESARSLSDSSSVFGGEPSSSLLSQTMDSLMSRIKSMEESHSLSDTEDEINSVLSDRPLLEPAHLQFNLSIPAAPALGPTTPSIHFVCETASRLLFKTLHWVRSIQSFSLLKLSLQIELVRRSWASLFVLGLSQLARQTSIPSLLSLVVSHQQARLAGDTSLNVAEVAETVCKIHQFVKGLARLELDDAEFGFLKAIILFSEGKTRYIQYTTHRVLIFLRILSIWSIFYHLSMYSCIQYLSFFDYRLICRILQLSV